MITARQIMNTSFHSLSPETSLSGAARIFREASQRDGRRIFGMMVIDADGRLVGILSMYDILQFIQPKHAHIWSEMPDIDLGGLMENICRKSKAIRVGDIMSTEVVTVEADTHIFAVLEMMNRLHIRRVPVVEGQQVIGIVYISDLFFFLVERMT